MSESHECYLSRRRNGVSVSLRGELYRLGASIGAAGWRARLSEIESHEHGEIEQRSLAHLLEHSLTNVPYYCELGIPDARLDAYPLLSRGTL